MASIAGVVGIKMQIFTQIQTLLIDNYNSRVALDLRCIKIDIPTLSVDLQTFNTFFRALNRFSEHQIDAQTIE